MTRRTWLVLPVVLTMFACSESPIEPEPEPVPELPVIALTRIEVPTNVPAIVQNYFEKAYDLGMTLPIFNLYEINGVNRTGPHPDWRWTTKLGTWTVTSAANIISENSVSWNLKISFDNAGVDYWIAANGQTNLDGKIGTSWRSYDFATRSDKLVSTASWQLDKQGELSLYTEDSEGIRNELRHNLDGHLNLIVRQTGAKMFEAVWDSTGSGSWNTYNTTTGEETGSGTW